MRVITLVLLFMLAGETMAQTLTMSDVKPNVGQRCRIHKVDNPVSISPGNGGSSQVWDLSNAVFGGVDDVIYKIIPARHLCHICGAFLSTCLIFSYPRSL